MDREVKSKDELRQIVQDRVDQRTEIDGDNIIISISWHEEDESGCNWDWRFHGDSSWTDAVTAIGAELQNKYNLINGGDS